MANTPTLDSISTDDIREIGETIKNLQTGQTVRVTNNRLDKYVQGEIIEKVNQLNGKEFYEATIQLDTGEKAKIHANWRDIMPDSDDQETPYTGLIIEPFNDTAPAITDLKIV